MLLRFWYVYFICFVIWYWIIGFRYWNIVLNAFPSQFPVSSSFSMIRVRPASLLWWSFVFVFEFISAFLHRNCHLLLFFLLHFIMNLIVFIVERILCITSSWNHNDVSLLSESWVKNINSAIKIWNKLKECHDFNQNKSSKNIQSDF